MSGLALVLWLGVGLVTADGTANTQQLCTSSAPVIITHSSHVSRTLRGDWETPDVVVLTFTTAWPDALATMLRHLASSTQVLLLLAQDESEDRAIQWLESHGVQQGAVELLDLAVDSGWVRDYGPLQTLDSGGGVIWLDADYSSRPSDDAVPRKLAMRFGIPVEAVPEGVEGGAIVSNGAGLCVSTIEVFEANSITTGDVEATDALLQQIGCQTLALLPALAQEMTKHADMFVQFIDTGTAAVASFDPAVAPQDAQRMDEAAQMLREAASRLGAVLHIVRIPHPPPREEKYFSYLNGLRVGSSFLIPHYTEVEPADEERAYAAFARHLPQLSLIPVASDDIINLNGAVHCVTLGLHLPDPRLASVARWRTLPRFRAMARQPQLLRRERPVTLR